MPLLRTELRIRLHRLARCASIASIAACTLASCERKAPGPAECRQLAAAYLRLTDARLLAHEGIKAQYDRLVVECLTMPYDRELVSCVTEQRGRDVCRAEFRVRLQDRQAPQAER